MDNKITFLKELGFNEDSLCEMDEITYIDEYGKKILVFNNNEFTDYCKYYMKNEISYLPLSFLKPLMKNKYQNEQLLLELMELSKHDANILWEKIKITTNLFWLEFLKLHKNNKIEDFIFDESTFLTHYSYSNIFAIYEK